MKKARMGGPDSEIAAFDMGPGLPDWNEKCRGYRFSRDAVVTIKSTKI